MDRTLAGSDVSSKSQRLKVKPDREPYWIQVAPGQSLGYLKPLKGGAGTWRARLYLPDTRAIKKVALGTADDVDAADGERILSYGQALKKASKWVEDTLGAIRKAAAGQVVTVGPYTVQEAWLDYLADAVRRGVKGIRIMTQTAEAHIIPALGAVEVERINRKQIEDWHKALSTAPRRTNRKPKEDDEPAETKELTQDQERARRDTANRILTVLKALLNFAADRGKTGESALPWRLVKPFKDTTSQRMRFLTVAEQQKLVAACDAEFRPLVIGALYTGGRYGELCAVRVKDFNATTKTLFIQWGKGKGAAVSRHVALAPEAVSWFAEFTKGRSPEELMWRRDAVERTTRAEALKDQDGWVSYDQDHPMEKAVVAAGIDRVTFHELRHTYASGLLNAGCPLAFVALQLGHKGTRMCERHYGHIAGQALAASISKLSPKLGLFSVPGSKPVGRKPKLKG